MGIELPVLGLILNGSVRCAGVCMCVIETDREEEKSVQALVGECEYFPSQSLTDKNSSSSPCFFLPSNAFLMRQHISSSLQLRAILQQSRLAFENSFQSYPSLYRRFMTKPNKNG